MTTRIGIITVPRFQGLDTLARVMRTMRCMDGLARNAEFGVFSDGAEAPTVDGVCHVELRTPQEMETLLHERVNRRYYGGGNLARALRWASESDVAVVSEDDLLVSNRWLEASIALLRVAEGAGLPLPVICLSHAHEEMEEAFIATGLRWYSIELWRKNGSYDNNGFAPAVMSGATAARVAEVIGLKYSARESDAALLWTVRDDLGGSLLYSDPCLALHIGLDSTYAPLRNYRGASTKRFRPW